MTTTPDGGIDKLITRIGVDLQRLEGHLKQNGDKRCKVRFPRGFLRTAQHFRSRFWFIRDANLKRNIGYSLILILRALHKSIEKWAVTKYET